MDKSPNAYERFRKVIDYALSLKKQSAVLDLGCGTCDMWETVAKAIQEKDSEASDKIFSQR